MGRAGRSIALGAFSDHDQAKKAIDDLQWLGLRDQ